MKLSITETNGIERELNDSDYTEEVVPSSEELLEIQAQVEKDKYLENRRNNYPLIGDQLDALFHAGVFPQEMADKLQAVKNAHPKPTGE